MIVAITLIFVIGYLCIAIEHSIKINKAAIALLTGVLCWTLYILLSGDKEIVVHKLLVHVGDFSGILFFLMGAMVIVELIDAHNGFSIITDSINVKSNRTLLWIICLVAFFLSAVLDNLTTTIVMISLLNKFTLSKTERLQFVSLIVIAANAGGAWTPIGDVTTTMLWISNRITSVSIMHKLFLPSIVCILVPLGILSFSIRSKQPAGTHDKSKNNSPYPAWERNIVFFLGIGSLLFVPVFKTTTHLPPFMGILLGLALLWIVTELMHTKKEEKHKNALSVSQALQRIDMPSVLFFLGILIAIAALESSGILGSLAVWLNTHLKNIDVINIALGVLSAVVDNVPLVAGMMGSYTLADFPVDHKFWTFLAYCAGTGGSMLIIGSAAGVVAMGLAKINFMWYLRNISLLALTGYGAGAAVFLLLNR